MKSLILFCFVILITEFSVINACKPKCGRNAYWCNAASTCPVTCASCGKNNMPTCDGLAPGCMCKEGYVFKDNQKGDCVKPDLCPKKPGGSEQHKCGRHAHWSSEASVCPVTCATYGKKGVARCLALGPGCECDEGYTFKENQKGDCVKSDQCPKCPDDGGKDHKCGRHAVWNPRTSSCPETCSRRGTPRCRLPLRPGCQCEKGYIFEHDQKGDCIKECDCPESADHKCGRHAVWNSETSSCPETCSRRGPPVCRLPLRPGCQCEKGYIFKDNQKGDCVKECDCPASADHKCGRHAVWNPRASPCPETCSNRGPPRCRQALRPGCQCEKGYIFEHDQKGDCVKECDCPASADHKCGRHAVWMDRTSACPETCSRRGPPRCKIALSPGCQCEKGYIFKDDQNGDCVKECDCPASADHKCGRHAVWNPRTSGCPETCSNRGPPRCRLALRPGCQCEKGYIFEHDQKGDCVKECDCPESSEQHKCGLHAHWSSGASVCPVTCATYGKKGIARCLALGPGCECDEGYTFKENQKGDCVKPEECPECPDCPDDEKPKCGLNAHYSNAASGCPVTCATYGKKGVATCFSYGPGCECDDGYTFKENQKGDCVKPDQCPKKPDDECEHKCGRHAHWKELTSVCPATCSKKSGQQACLALAAGCECEPGYIFKDNQKGDCVKECDCEDDTTNHKCGLNAHWSEETSVCPATCSARGGLYCLALGPGCECDKGYIFEVNQKGDCITECECPIEDERYEEEEEEDIDEEFSFTSDTIN